ncbi:hypothetical protein EJD97_024184 [Solanum chilense]|uniref:Uncharacterized protein n=1 Tax=Solanum chilense TaxID=4083 RepID=A0A6N2CFG2_SOLCI|nr:hypothetical protein EJD97_024184 [Solanum chilense]
MEPCFWVIGKLTLLGSLFGKRLGWVGSIFGFLEEWALNLITVWLRVGIILDGKRVGISWGNQLTKEIFHELN